MRAPEVACREMSCWARIDQVQREDPENRGRLTVAAAEAVVMHRQHRSCSDSPSTARAREMEGRSRTRAAVAATTVPLAVDRHFHLYRPRSPRDRSPTHPRRTKCQLSKTFPDYSLATSRTRDTRAAAVTPVVARPHSAPASRTRSGGNDRAPAGRIPVVRLSRGSAVPAWRSSATTPAPSPCAVAGIGPTLRRCAFVYRQPISKQLARQQVPEWDLDLCQASTADNCFARMRGPAHVEHSRQTSSVSVADSPMTKSVQRSRSAGHPGPMPYAPTPIRIAAPARCSSAD